MAAEPAAAPALPPVHIWYATVTGTATDVADRLRRDARRRGVPVRVDSVERASLVRRPALRAPVKAPALVLTHRRLPPAADAPALGPAAPAAGGCLCRVHVGPGRGAARPAGTTLHARHGTRRPACLTLLPSTAPAFPSAQPLWRELARRSLPAGLLAGVKFAVFGLGDSSYAKYARLWPLADSTVGAQGSKRGAAPPRPAATRFNYVGKKLTRRLEQLGAAPLVPRGDGDDQHPRGYVRLSHRRPRSCAVAKSGGTAGPACLHLHRQRRRRARSVGRRAVGGPDSAVRRGERVGPAGPRVSGAQPWARRQRPGRLPRSPLCATCANAGYRPSTRLSW